MPESKTIKEIGNIIRDIKLGNSFLFVGVFLTLSSFYIQDTSFSLIGIKIGIITLFFGGLFRLLNIVMKPLKNIENKVFKELKYKSDEKEIIEKINFNQFAQNYYWWKDILRFFVWTIILIIYIVWINWILIESDFEISIIPFL